MSKRSELNKCSGCGKFKKWDDLVYCAGDSDDVGNFPEWFECRDCCPVADEKPEWKTKEAVK